VNARVSRAIHAAFILIALAAAARADDTSYAAFQLLIGRPLDEQLERTLTPGSTENVPDGRLRSRFLDLRPPPLGGDRAAFREIRAAIAVKATEVVRRRADVRYGVRAVLLPYGSNLAQLMPTAIRDGMPREGDVVALATDREVRVTWSRVNEDAVKDSNPPVAVVPVPAGREWVDVLDAELGKLEAERTAWLAERDDRRGGTTRSDLVPLVAGLVLAAALWPLLGRLSARQ